MPRPVLTTARIALRPLTGADVEDLVELDSDPAVMRYLTGRAATRSEVLEGRMAQRTDPGHEALGLGYWCGFRRENGAFLGWWCLTPRSGRGLAELGYRLRRDAWGQGLASEGARALLRHGFTTVGLRGVVAETMAVNTGSRRVLEALGMRHDHTEVREWERPLPDAELGEVFYLVGRDAWLDAFS